MLSIIISDVPIHVDSIGGKNSDRDTKNRKRRGKIVGAELRSLLGNYLRNFNIQIRSDFIYADLFYSIDFNLRSVENDKRIISSVSRISRVVHILNGRIT